MAAWSIVSYVFASSAIPMAYLVLTTQVLNESSMLEQVPPSNEDEECLITDSQGQGSPRLSLYTSDQTTLACNSALPSPMSQLTPSNTVMAQQARTPNGFFSHKMIKTWPHGLGHSAYEQRTPLKPVYATGPLFGTEECFYLASKGEEKTYEELEMSFSQDVKHPSRKRPSESSRSSETRLGSTTKPPRVNCKEPRRTKSFTKRHSMKRHMQSHMKRNPYACGKPERHYASAHSESFRGHRKHAYIHRGCCGCHVSRFNEKSADYDP